MSVDAECSKDHVSVIEPYAFILSEAYVGMVKLRSGMAFSGKWTTVSWQGQRE
jgi:hypothetical protein